jgi:hypothetical protein
MKAHSASEESLVWKGHWVFRLVLFPFLGLAPAVVAGADVIDHALLGYGVSVVYWVSLVVTVTVFPFFSYRWFLRPRLTARNSSGLEVRNPFSKYQLGWANIAAINPTQDPLTLTATDGTVIQVWALATQTEGGNLAPNRPREVAEILERMRTEATDSPF